MGEEHIQKEVDVLIYKLEQKVSKPLSLADNIPLALVSSLWAIIQGERLNTEDPNMLKLVDLISHFFHDSGKLVGQRALCSSTFMRLSERLGLTNIGQAFRVFFSIVDPVIENHREHFDANKSAQDFIDQFLLEIEVTVLVICTH